MSVRSPAHTVLWRRGAAFAVPVVALVAVAVVGLGMTGGPVPRSPGSHVAVWSPSSVTTTPPTAAPPTAAAPSAAPLSPVTVAPDTVRVHIGSDVLSCVTVDASEVYFCPDDQP